MNRYIRFIKIDMDRQSDKIIDRKTDRQDDSSRQTKKTEKDGIDKQIHRLIEKRKKNRHIDC